MAMGCWIFTFVIPHLVVKKIKRINYLLTRCLGKDSVPHFEDKAEEYGLDAPGTYTSQSAFFDFDRMAISTCFY